MSLISSLQEIQDLFPDSFIEVGSGELHSPCPFCDPSDGDVTEHNGHLFVGEDRFVWFADGHGTYCRREGRSYSHQQIIDRLAPGDRVSPDLSLEKKQIRREFGPPTLHSEAYIDLLHSQVQRDYWYRFGWSDAVIDRFRLGYGRMYPASALTQPQRHMIPFRPWTVHGPAIGQVPDTEWALEGRLPKGVEGPANVKTKGLVGNQYFWLIEDDPSDRRIAITEGLKDAISATVLGIANIFATFGAQAWQDSFAQFVVERGYTEIWLFGDHDRAGQDYNDRVKSTFQSFAEPPRVFAFEHLASDPEGHDLTDYLAEFGPDPDRLRERLRLMSFVVKRGYIGSFREVDPDYQPANRGEARTYLSIREEIPEVIDEYLRTFHKLPRKLRSVKILAAPPGVGKTHALVRAAEKAAHERLKAHKSAQEASARLIQQYRAEYEAEPDPEKRKQIQQRLDKEQKRADNRTVSQVLFVGPFVAGIDDIWGVGADPDLWYDYQARNPSNCEMMAQPNPEVSLNEIGERNYTIMQYCMHLCPFAARCKEEGYLAQEKQRVSKPITYARHQNLATDIVDDYRIIMIDENPLTVFDTPIRAEREDFRPLNANWSDFLDPEQVILVERLVKNILYLLEKETNPRRIYSGYDFLVRLNTQMEGRLFETLEQLDDRVVEAYQPNNLLTADIRHLPRRILPLCISLIRAEIQYLADRNPRYNSRIHQIGSTLELYELKPIHIPATKPVLVADGTALPELYGLLFDRPISLYAPQIYSDNAEVTVLHGSDFSRTTYNKQIGIALDDYFKYLNERRATIDDLFGGTLELETIPLTDKHYDSSALKRTIQLLEMVASRHGKTLFVTHKPIRLLVEAKLRESSPELVKKISFGHFGSLRGTNRYKDHEAVLVVGVPRVSYDDLHRRVQAWASLDSTIPYVPYSGEPVIGVAPYHGRTEGYSYVTLETEFAQRFVDMVEVGEVRQCVDRIRLFSTPTTASRHAYIAMSRPAVPWVSSLTQTTDWLKSHDDSKQSQVIQFASNHWRDEGRWPTQREVLARFGGSARDISAYLKKAKEGLAG